MATTKKIDVIVFSYKRAILLDNCLNSLITNLSNINYPIHVIYRHNHFHHKSYLKLKKIYGNKIRIWKRDNKFFYTFKTLIRPINWLWLFKWKNIFLERSNFKNIFENILKNLSNEHVMLCTDDTVFIKKNNISNKILNLISSFGRNFWFRPNFGLDLNYKGKLDFIDKNYLTWNSDGKNLTYFMKYNFQVEGSIYNRKTLYEFVKPFIYYNPTTLEAIGYKEAKYRNYFKNAISPLKRTAFTYELNSVQNDTKLRFNDRPQYNPELLASYFLKGYRLRIKYNKNYFKIINEFGNKRMIPIKLYLYYKKKKVEVSKLFFK